MLQPKRVPSAALERPRTEAIPEPSRETGRASCRWLILLTIWMTYLTVQVMRLSIGPIATFLKTSLGISRSEIGFLISATGLLYLPTMAISGYLADRFGVRKLLMFGTLSGGLAVLLIFFFPTYHAMLVLMLLSGVGFGCIFATAVKGIIVWFPHRERATAIGINQTAINLAGVLSAAVFPSIALALGWRYSFLFCGLGVLLVGGGGAFLYRDPPWMRSDPSVHVLKTGRISSDSMGILKSLNIWLLVVGTLFVFIVEFAVIGNLVLYLTEDIGVGVVVAGTILAVTQLSGMVSKPLSGFISDRFAGGRRKPVYLAMCVLATIACLFPTLDLGDSGWWIYPVFIVVGATTIGSGGVYTAMAGEIGGSKAAGTSVGIITAVAGSGYLIGPPLFGMVVDLTGSYRSAWFLMAICGMISVILIGLVRERPVDAVVSSNEGRDPGPTVVGKAVIKRINHVDSTDEIDTENSNGVSPPGDGNTLCS